MAGNAAPQNGRQWTLDHVKARFAELKEQCQHFDQLEDGIRKFGSDVSEAAAIVNDIHGMLTQTQISAITSMLEDIQDAQDAFSDYAGSRRRRQDDEHVIGRMAVGKILRGSVQNMINYLDGLSLP